MSTLYSDVTEVTGHVFSSIDYMPKPKREPKPIQVATAAINDSHSEIELYTVNFNERSYQTQDNTPLMQNVEVAPSIFEKLKENAPKVIAVILLLVALACCVPAICYFISAINSLLHYAITQL